MYIIKLFITNGPHGFILCKNAKMYNYKYLIGTKEYHILYNKSEIYKIPISLNYKN